MRSERYTGRPQAQEAATLGNLTTVTVMSNGTQQVTPVTIGLKGDTSTQIKTGLTAGQQVVLSTATTGSTSSTGFPSLGGTGLGGGFGGTR